MSNEGSSEQPTGPFLHGGKRTWEIVFDAAQEAVRSLARPVSVTEIREHITTQNFAQGNVNADLSMLTVNSFARGNYKPMNREPRRCDSGSEFDRLFKSGSGRDLRYAMYDPEFHGIWELADVGDKVLRPHFVETSDIEELDRARGTEVSRGMFDPDEDARKRALTAIVQREGQPAFRQALLEAYEGTCVITGCAVKMLLEAAHIIPYKGAHTNEIGNGLLLRVDLHKLFDLHQISIEPETRIVRVSHALRVSEYARFDGVRLRDPVNPSQAPLAIALERHRDRCGWLNAGPNGEPLDEVN